jgi:hypothetical protein
MINAAKIFRKMKKILRFKLLEELFFFRVLEVFGLGLEDDIGDFFFIFNVQ